MENLFIHSVTAQKVIDLIYYIDGVIVNNYIRIDNVLWVKSHLRHHLYTGSKYVRHLNDIRERL